VSGCDGRVHASWLTGSGIPRLNIAISSQEQYPTLHKISSPDKLFQQNRELTYLRQFGDYTLTSIKSRSGINTFYIQNPPVVTNRHYSINNSNILIERH